MKSKSIPAAPPVAVAPARLETLARSLTVTVDDIGTMTLAAGVEAMEEALAACGRLELPLRFHIAPPGTRAVFIPEEFHRHLVSAGQLADLDDPAGDIADNQRQEAEVIPFGKGGPEA
jgi:hypothetical protein